MENKFSQMSMLEVALELMAQKRTPQLISKLIEEVLECKALTDEDGSLTAQLYVDITTSSKFVYMGNNEWDLKGRQSLDVWDKDGSAYNTKEDSLASVEDEDDELDDFDDLDSEDEEDDEDEEEDEDDSDFDDDDEEEEDTLAQDDDELDDFERDEDGEQLEKYSEDDDFDEDKYNDLMDDFEDMYEN